VTQPEGSGCFEKKAGKCLRRQARFCTLSKQPRSAGNPPSAGKERGAFLCFVSCGATRNEGAVRGCVPWVLYFMSLQKLMNFRKSENP